MVNDKAYTGKIDIMPNMLIILNERRVWTLPLVRILGMFTCCSAIFIKVDDTGNTKLVIFLNVIDATTKDATRPDLNILKSVHPGATKGQIYYLLGRPHFNEGVLGVREWDYLFYLSTLNGELKCQYKILSDKKMKAPNFYWKPSECKKNMAHWVNEPVCRIFYDCRRSR